MRAVLHLARVGGDGRVLDWAHVRFSPGARTAWHHHFDGWTLQLTGVIGLVAKRGGDVQETRPGDVVYIQPGEEHGRVACATRFMAHVAMQDADQNGGVDTWLNHVNG